jgi:hypothetical protein
MVHIPGNASNAGAQHRMSRCIHQGDAAMTDTSTPATTFACPDWCDRVDCDSFDIETATGQPVRAHEHVITGDDGLFVAVTAKERLTPAGLVAEPVAIFANAGGFDGMREMTPRQALDLRKALKKALELVYEIEAASTS